MLSQLSLLKYLYLGLSEFGEMIDGGGLSHDVWTPEIFGPCMQTLKTNPAIQTLETIKPC